MVSYGTTFHNSEIQTGYTVSFRLNHLSPKELNLHLSSHSLIYTAYKLSQAGA